MRFSRKSWMVGRAGLAAYVLLLAALVLLLLVPLALPVLGAPPLTSATGTVTETPAASPTASPSPTVVASGTPRATPTAGLKYVPYAAKGHVLKTATFTPTPTLTPTRTPKPTPTSCVRIEFTRVPPWGTTEKLHGRVNCVDPETHRVAVFIYAVGAWWTKPYWSDPLTRIRDDGTWSTTITTGGQDPWATRVAAFLVRADYEPPLMSGGGSLPATLYESALAYIIAEREP